MFTGWKPWPRCRVPAPDPIDIYRETQEEGRRRLSRPLLELAATALVAGFDLVIGITAMGVVHALVAPRFGEDVAVLAGAIAFGLGFVFIVVGRSELFTENFLIPIAGLDRRDRRSWYKLGELWTVSPALNLVGAFALAIVVTSHGVLPEGSGSAFVSIASQIGDRGHGAAFLGAILAGALITLMTWLVEGGAADSIGARMAAAWAVGAILAVGFFNHSMVSTVELFFGIRYGAPVSWNELFVNLAIAIAGNLVGGVLLVTVTRTSQARGAAAGESL
jgi:formate/nitrite transporter FocA (FNT family)